MPNFNEPLPLSLYIHIPWCVRKCPYCDFNSHTAKNSLPEQMYVHALLQELDEYLPLIQGRSIQTIFFGGGTPSLFSGHAIQAILKGVAQNLSLSKDIEITLEANPGTIDQARFEDFRQAGINRLSLGVQSLQDEKLKMLGRIHDSSHAISAIKMAKEAGFTHFNIDLMFGLPHQSKQDALYDLEKALDFAPPHLSWYQLTIEPNTLFYREPPVLPADDAIWDIQLAGLELLIEAGLHQYEVSAYAKSNQACAHNLNYWEFGDYLGIGAGAHSKITDMDTGKVIRFSQVKHPKDYLDPTKRQAHMKYLDEKDIIFEFMLNALRLTQGVASELFTQRTGLSLQSISSTLALAKERNLLLADPLVYAHRH